VDREGYLKGDENVKYINLVYKIWIYVILKHMEMWMKWEKVFVSDLMLWK